MLPRVAFDSSGNLKIVARSLAVLPLSAIGGFLVDQNGAICVPG